MYASRGANSSNEILGDQRSRPGTSAVTHVGGVSRAAHASPIEPTPRPASRHTMGWQAYVRPRNRASPGFACRSASREDGMRDSTRCEHIERGSSESPGRRSGLLRRADPRRLLTHPQVAGLLSLGWLLMRKLSAPEETNDAPKKRGKNAPISRLGLLMDDSQK